MESQLESVWPESPTYLDRTSWWQNAPTPVCPVVGACEGAFPSWQVGCSERRDWGPGKTYRGTPPGTHFIQSLYTMSENAPSSRDKIYKTQVCGRGNISHINHNTGTPWTRQWAMTEYVILSKLRAGMLLGGYCSHGPKRHMG